MYGDADPNFGSESSDQTVLISAEHMFNNSKNSQQEITKKEWG